MGRISPALCSLAVVARELEKTALAQTSRSSTGGGSTKSVACNSRTSRTYKTPGHDPTAGLARFHPIFRNVDRPASAVRPSRELLLDLPEYPILRLHSLSLQRPAQYPGILW